MASRNAGQCHTPARSAASPATRWFRRGCLPALTNTGILTVKSLVAVRSRLSLLTRPLSSASIVVGLALTMAWVSALAYGLCALVWSML